MAPSRASLLPSLETITDEEILELVSKLRLSVVSSDHQAIITETAGRLLQMLSFNPQVQIVLAKEATVLGVLHDLLRGFHVSEAALVSGLELLQCLADGPASCKDSITQCVAWAQPTALLAAVVALLKGPQPAVIAAAARCLCTLSSDLKQQMACCRVLLQQYKHRSAATLLAGILKEGVKAERSATAAKSLRTSTDIHSVKGSKPGPTPTATASQGTIHSNSSSSKADKLLSTHSAPLAAITTKGLPSYQPPQAAVQAALTLRNLARAVPDILAGEAGVISALVAGLGSSSPELQLPCLKAVAALTASKSAVFALAKSKGSEVVPLLAGLRKSSQDSVGSCADMALRAVSRYYSRTPRVWAQMLCQQPTAHGG